MTTETMSTTGASNPCDRMAEVTIVAPVKMTAERARRSVTAEMRCQCVYKLTVVGRGNQGSVV